MQRLLGKFNKIKVKVAKIANNHDLSTIKKEKGQKLYEELTSLYTTKSNMAIGYIFHYENTLCYIGGSQAEKRSNSYDRILGTTRIMRHIKLN